MFWWSPFFFDEKRNNKKTKNKNKKTATPFHQSMQVCIKQIMACKPLSAAVCCLKVSFTIKWRKSCQRNSIYNNQPAAILKDFRLENIDCTEYQLIFLTAEEILSKTFLAEEQNFLTVSLMGSTCVCFCRKTMLLVFNLTQFDWSPVHLREMQWRATNQGMFLFSTASSGRCPLALSPPPTSAVHSNSKSNMAGRKTDRELITLARPNNTPALRARLILILDNVEFPL